MNILDKLIPSLSDDTTEADELSPEEQAAQDKKDRIEYHRANVRCGPVKMKSPTSGQIRRHQARLGRSMQRKGYRRQVQAHFANQRETMALRHRLQSVGLLPYRTEVRVTEAAIMAAVVYIAQRFGEGEPGETVEVTESFIMDSLQHALNRYQALTGQQPTKLPEGYSLPVALT